MPNNRIKAQKIENAYNLNLEKYANSFNRRIRNVLNEIYLDLAKAAKKYEKEAYYTSNSYYIRNQKLSQQVNQILKEMRENIYLEIRTGMTEAWGQANAKNTEIYKSFVEGLTLPLATENAFNQLNLTALNEFIKRVERNGMSLSKRIWRLSHKFKYELGNVLGSGIAQGKDAVKLSRELEKFMNGGVSTVYQNGTVRRAIGKDVSYQALRLARTEVNMSYHMADFKRRKQLPFVTGIEVYLSDSHPVEDVCDFMQGRYPKDFVFLGWHPSCLCSSRSILLSEKEFADYIESGKIRKQRYVRTIPRKAQKYIDDRKDRILNYKNKPYFIRDNFDSDLQPLKRVTSGEI